MSKLYFPLSLAAVAVLAACASSDPVTPAPAPVVVTQAPAPVVTAPPPTVVVQQSPAPGVVAPSALRPGFGRVEAITALQTSAAAGGATMRRFGIKMEDGTVQYVDSAAQHISIGDRVELTRDAQIRR
jgi:hypothetical protein